MSKKVSKKLTSRSINSMRNKDNIIGKITNQIVSMNKKIKGFETKGIDEYNDFLINVLGENVEFNGNGRIRTRKDYFKSMDVIELKDTLNKLHKINNHEIYGTTKKYENEYASRLETLQYTVRDYLIGKGYNEDEVNLVTASGEFLSQLVVAFNDGGDSGFGSGQIMDKIYLNYSSTESTKFKKKALANIENSVNKARDIKRNEEDYQNYLNQKRGSR